MPVGAEIPGSYDPLLVVVSVLIAILASYTAIDLAIHVTAARGRARRVWLICGSVAMGIGIWSMHYVAMLAFRLPIPVRYHWPTALLSLLAGIVSFALALYIVARPRVPAAWILGGSVLQAGGIATLHYTAMASMRMEAESHYSAPIVSLSVLVAIMSSLLSLCLAFVFRGGPISWKLRKVGSALSMGVAIAAMHYTGMAAVSFTVSGMALNLANAVLISSLGLAGIVAVSVMVMLATVVTGLVDQLQKQKNLLDELFEQAPQAITLVDRDGMVVRVNREFERLFGYSLGEAVGRRLSELIVPADAQEEFERRTEQVAQGQRVETESVRRRKDGSPLHVLAVSVPVSLPGDQIAVYDVHLDITKRKEADAALQTLSRRLLAVQEDERQHLARELHDEIGQLLTGLRLLLKPNGEWPVGPVKTRFDQARSMVDELLGKVRRLSFDLRPADLDQLGLLPALLAFFERFTETTGMLVDFKHKDLDGRFATEVETAAYRIIQEALTNVARHAGVADAVVRVWLDGNVLNLRVEDRGSGFDPEAALKAARTRGLAGMQERAMLLGGGMTVESAPGRGTTVSVELPLRNAGDEPAA
jgi:PAS domain S-box-containing protein